MIDTGKLKQVKFENGRTIKGDYGRSVVVVVHGEELAGTLAGWQDGLVIVRLHSSVGFLCPYLFVPAIQAFWDLI